MRALTDTPAGDRSADVCVCVCVCVHTGEDFYGMYDAQNFAQKHAEELGMQTVPSLDVVYTEEEGYVTADVVCVQSLSAHTHTHRRGLGACARTPACAWTTRAHTTAPCEQWL